MEKEIFISNSINEAFKLYLENKERDYSLEFNSFLCSVLRMLVLIYGEEELVAAYQENDSEKFDNLLMKYGLEVDALDEFKMNFEKYYKFNIKQESKAIKKKNKFFNLVQKALIDMMVLKDNSEHVSDMIKEEFYELIFSANSKEFYRSSVAVKEAYNPYEVDNYAKKHLLGVEV